jgi:hypothetical protein
MRKVAATTPNYDFGNVLGPLQSRLVDVDKLTWVPTPYKGVDIKVLMTDETTGMMTALFRWQPGSVLPDHEHVETRTANSPPATMSGGRPATATSPAPRTARWS